MKAAKAVKSVKPGQKKAVNRPKILSVKDGKIKKTAATSTSLKKSVKRGPQPIVPHTLNATKVEQGISELLRIVDERSKSKSELFDTEGQAVLLTLACFRIANVAKRILRFILPHSLLQATSDVALIVRDLEPRKRKPDNEAVVQLYESRIRAHGIQHPITVLPIRQVMTEYNTYESKKQLCNQFDVFLADAHISNRLITILGKTFGQKRKNPIPVKIETHQMKQSIEKALSKSCLKLSADGGSFAIQVGHTQQKPQQIAENVVAVVEELCKVFPGGWPNIRNLIVKTSRSPGVPLFVAIRNPNEVHLVDSRHRLRHGEPVEDELSTALDAKVRVYPSGRVKKLAAQNSRIAHKLARKAEIKEKRLAKKTKTTTLKERRKLRRATAGAEEEAEGSGEEEEAGPDSGAESYESGSEDEQADEAEEAYLTERSHTDKHLETKKKTEDKKQKQKSKKIKS